MELYVDESGQTGCIKYSNNENLSFEQQPIFANGALIIKDEKVKNNILKKYLKFKKEFAFESEVKGSDLLTRENNRALDYFINNILNDRDFVVNLYDKRFYVATLLCLSILGEEFRDNESIVYYQIAGTLSFQEDDFYIEYLKFIEDVNEETTKQYFDFLCNYNYNCIDNIELWMYFISKIVDDNDENKYMSSFMTYTWYEDDEKINVINLNSLSELIFFIKERECVKNDDLLVTHDRIEEFEELIKTELSNYNININFEGDSNYFLEIADNVVSIFAHAFNKMKKALLENTIFEEKNKWDMCLLSKLIDKIGESNIKYTISVQDWASMLSIKEMFSANYHGQMNYLSFNLLYIHYQEIIYNDIQMNMINSQNVEKILLD